ALTSITLSGSKTNVGEYDGAIVPSAAAIGNNTGNYIISYNPNKLTITKKAVTIEVDPKTKVYDNDPSTDPELTATVTGAVAGDTINYTLSREPGQGVGEYAITVELGDNPNYDVTVIETGKFVITNAIITITITGDSSTQYTYDGQPHTAGGYTIDCDSPLFDPDKVIFTGTDSVTAIDAGTYPFGLSADQFSYDDPNFAVTFVVTDGEMKINPAAVIVRLHGDTDQAVYDGKDHAVAGYTVDSISNRLYTENDFGLAPGNYAMAIRQEEGRTYMGLTAESFVNNNPNFTVTFQVTDGWILVYESGEEPDPGHDPGPSPDLNYDHFAYIMGYPDGTFQPGWNINRAEAATMIYRLLTEARQNEIFTTENDFNDVEPWMWYNDYVSSMANGGYVKGYPDGSFRGGNYITRAEFVTLLVRFFRLEDVECSFKDVSPDHWAYKYIATATYFGWLAGYEDGTFRPDQPITRAEAVTVVNRMLQRGVNGSSDLGNFKTFTDVTDPNSWYYYEVIEAANTHKALGKRPDEIWLAVA
ncbi:MAG: S-layer homology domain-containing protein, partial [Oscillospiraceae bacterium]|nr:S-layer homology domain-containing protein [Oscillospiraceae bacterium]